MSLQIVHGLVLAIQDADQGGQVGFRKAVQVIERPVHALGQDDALDGPLYRASKAEAQVGGPPQFFASSASFCSLSTIT